MTAELYPGNAVAKREDLHDLSVCVGTCCPETLCSQAQAHKLHSHCGHTTFIVLQKSYGKPRAPMKKRVAFEVFIWTHIGVQLKIPRSN